MSDLTDVLESTNLPGSQESQPSGSSNATEGEYPFGAPPAEGEAEVSGTASEDAPADGNVAEVDKMRQQNADLDAKLTRSRQEIANYKQRLFDLNPLIEAGMKVQGQPPATAQQPQPPNSQEAFLSKIEEIVSRKVAETWDQKNFDSRSMDKLEKRASAEIDGFDKMREHPAYIDMVQHAISLQERGSVKLRDEDKTYSAMTYAADMFLASNPAYMKAVKETGKKEALDKAARKAVAESAGGGPSKTEVIGGERKATEEEQDRINILQGYRGRRRSLPRAQR